MSTLVTYLILPVITFVGLVLLPPGRPALLGIAVAALTVVILGPVVLREDGSGFGSLLRWVFCGAVGSAALAQALRLVRLPGRRGLPYPLVVVMILAGATLMTARILGMF